MISFRSADDHRIDEAAILPLGLPSRTGGKHMKIRAIIGRSLIAAAIAASVSAGTAEAAPPVPAASSSVAYRSADLASSRGRAKLASRIAWAATSLCLEDDRASPAPQSVDMACYRSVMANALDQMKRAVANATARAPFQSAQLP
jgi:UrcA family protein